MDHVNLTIEDLIDAGHAEAATMAEWKDGLNESWADFLVVVAVICLSVSVRSGGGSECPSVWLPAASTPAGFIES